MRSSISVSSVLKAKTAVVDHYVVVAVGLRWSRLGWWCPLVRWWWWWRWIEAFPTTFPSSPSCHLSCDLRRAFMKKLPTVLSSSPSCCEMVICISLEGRFVSLKMACKVRRCRSVNTNRGFLGVLGFFGCCCCCSSFRLQAGRKESKYIN